jgi:hypothetical protein
LADQLHVVRDASAWSIALGTRRDPSALTAHLACAAQGPALQGWRGPEWLFPHQVRSASRVLGVLQAFGGAILADEVGLGKTYVALAVAQSFATVTAVVPAALLPQWRRTAGLGAQAITLVSLESLSRGGRVPRCDLLIVDEAHRLRNPRTKRYDIVARDIGRARVLLVTATPLVNHPRDLAALLRLFLADNGLAPFGVASLQSPTDALALGRAAAPVIVAQASTGVALPLPTLGDHPVCTLPPLTPHRLRRVLDRVDALRFPTVGGVETSHLLRQHLLLRVASSPAAARETLRRHLTYLDRVAVAVEQGQQLPRGVARRILGPGDDMQLELLAACDWEDTPVESVTRDEIAAERHRIDELLQLMRTDGPNPKLEALRGLLARRKGQKTVVFVTCVATGRDLASRLRWQSVGFIGAGTARIATGPIPVERALQLFAPRVRHAIVPPHLQLVTLIATDIMSEGVDLQDADGVVHYDLPWTPMRLAQRVGRVTRIGARHTATHVWWFAPTPAIERRLRLTARLDRKVADQTDTAVAVTSGVGRARVLGTQLEARAALGEGVSAPPTADPCFAVVRGRSSVVAAVEWRLGATSSVDLLAMDGRPAVTVADYVRTRMLCEELLAARSSVDLPPPPELRRGLAHVLRTRAWAAADSETESTVALRRCALDRAVAAGNARATELLRTLDRVLQVLRLGVPIGPERRLREILAGEVTPSALTQWLQLTPRPRSPVSYRILAALFGDGSAEK